MPITRPDKSIRIRGAREHNLAGVDVELARDQLIVITGVSGSGKSSLAFDTIFAEGQRKYMESLSAYARQFLDQMQKPDIESIEGLPPTIAIHQRAGGHNPRSTVATTTEIWDYLRLLFARCGTPTCWHRSGKKICGREISATSASQIVEAIIGNFNGRRVQLCAPVVRSKKGFHKEVLESLQRQGFVRARVNAEVMDLREVLLKEGENPLGIGRYEMHDIEAVVDRIKIDDGDRQRVVESVETALQTGEGSLLVIAEESDGNWSEHRFSDRFACPDHPDHSLDSIEPRLFSFNSPHGACSECSGLGTILEFDEELVVPDPTKPIAESVEPWRKNGKRMNIWYGRQMRKFLDNAGIERDTPFSEVPANLRTLLFHGTSGKDEKKLGFKFVGVIPNLRRRIKETESDHVRERLHGYTTSVACPRCSGARLRPASLAVFLKSEKHTANIFDVASMTIRQAMAFIESMTMDAERTRIGEPILREIGARLGFLNSVGLGYLTLDRSSSTLSGGEAQRIRLATQVGSGLVGVCYVLDEPTIGLHARDNDRLITTLRHLSDIGNTVLVVEHDESMMRAADQVLDIGPGPGRHGGTVVAQGTIDEIAKIPGSVTGAFLSGRETIEVPAERRLLDVEDAIQITGASEHNLQNMDVSIPLGGIVCVTGVSGSGKSTLVNDVVLRSAQREVTGTRVVPGAVKSVTGLEEIDRIIEVDQSPIGRTPRSNPATYTGILDDVRKLFAQTAESKIRGYLPGRFSFNVKGGRCEACQGQGVRRIEMHFLPDVFVTCEECNGLRYNRETLEVRFRGKNIADVLAMTVEEAVDFFEAHRKVHRMLECVRDVGLGYLQLGQPSTTLSGGEAQRVKLASELGTATQGHTLYILDEPTTGLHFADVKKLLDVMQRLADNDNSLIVIEHNLDVIKCADWIIDLGPEGGSGGGQVIATGMPEDICECEESYTGQFLLPILEAAEVAETV
ncbi:MAG: excinuclease ABC subunit A [Planctomycetes bacterium TMED75]|nr:excinuclease ABC subunit A [Planctomycetaceae bacterium]OUU91884.1 MAG: excinuclease ABC subunit A [Planctomycetes bacterium TMED75]